METIVLEGGKADGAWAVTADVCADSRDRECEVRVTLYGVSAEMPRERFAKCSLRSAVATVSDTVCGLLQEKGIPLAEAQRDSLDSMSMSAVNLRTRI
jgi:hypothetical protein